MVDVSLAHITVQIQSAELTEVDRTFEMGTFTGRNV